MSRVGASAQLGCQRRQIEPCRQPGNKAPAMLVSAPMRCDRTLRGIRRKTGRTLVLEPLESRRLLTNFMPSPDVADGAPNSLRLAIALSNSNGQDNIIVLRAGLY